MEVGSAPQRANVVLTGFMGTGKSTVGRLVAATLRYGFVDTDRLIEERHGPIPELFATHGEDHFRRIERGSPWGSSRRLPSPPRSSMHA